MNFSVVVRFFREAVGMFWKLLVYRRRPRQYEHTRLAVTYVVDCGKGAIRSSHFAIGVAEALESLLQSRLAPAKRTAYAGGSLLVMSLRGQDVCLQVVSERNSKEQS
jgi:hypothetical protein